MGINTTFLFSENIVINMNSKTKFSPQEQWDMEEFVLFFENDYAFHLWLTVDWYNTLAVKRARGVWDKEKAVDAMYNNVVPVITKIYNKKFGDSRKLRFTPAAKRVLAEALLSYIMEEGLKNVRKGMKNYKRELPNTATGRTVYAVYGRYL